jgi:hypothetical protein
MSNLNQPLCNADSNGWVMLKAVGGNGNYHYKIAEQEQFSPANFFDNLTSGHFKGYVRDVNNCLDSSRFFLPEPDKLEFASLQTTPSYCDTQSGIINISMQGGTKPYYIVDSSYAFSSVVSVPNLTAGHHTVAIVDKYNCATENSVFVEYVQGTAIELQSKVDPFCFDHADGSIAIEVTQGESPFQYKLNGQLKQGNVFDNLPEGTYKVVVTDVNDCADSVVTELNQPEPLLLQTSQVADPICYNDNTGFIKTRASGGTRPYQVTWNEQLHGEHIYELTAGTYHYEVLDANNCSDIGSVYLENPSPVNVSLIDTLHICANQTKTLDAVFDNYNYKWYRNNTLLSTERTIDVSDGGRYVLEVISPKGCSASDSTLAITYNYNADAHLLMPTEGMVNDILVMIDVSYPAPDSLDWIVPSDFFTIYENYMEQHVVPVSEGGYMAGLIAYTGNCVAEHYKAIQISGVNNGKASTETNQKLILNARAMPNPTNNQTMLNVELSSEADLYISVFSSRGGKVAHLHSPESLLHNATLKVAGWQQGVYVVQLRAKDEVVYIKLIVI